MKIIGSNSVHRLILAAALSIGLALATHASAVDYLYLIDLKTRTATGLGSDTSLPAINNAGQVTRSNYITGPNGVGKILLDRLGGVTAGCKLIQIAD